MTIQISMFILCLMMIFCGVTGDLTEPFDQEATDAVELAVDNQSSSFTTFNADSQSPEVTVHPKNFTEGLMDQPGFFHGFVAAISVILVSELGDKTFLIAVILAMTYSRVIVFLGSMTALVVMTVLSACLGFATSYIPRIYVHYTSVALFILFGLKMLKEGYSMSSSGNQEEYEEVQRTVNSRDLKLQDQESSIETGGKPPAKSKRKSRIIFWVFFEAFTMTFLAEWGDRSQLTTIVLAARENAIGVTLGAVAGHAICTLLAVLGGKFVAQWISVRTITLLGGILFLIFAVVAIIKGPESAEESVNTSKE